jgi:hypothetical protein
MIVRVNWQAWKNNPVEANPKGPADMYHVYQCTNYLVEIMGYSGSSLEEGGPSRVNLFLNPGTDGGSNEILLSNGDTAYIMNDAGKTIDVIRTF